MRHGETVWNKTLRYQGQSDIPLSEEGIRQADLLAKRLEDKDIGAIYSSDLQRAKKTAEKIAKYHNLAVDTDPRVRELSFGIWEGHTYDEMAKGWPEELKQWHKTPFTVGPPKGETLKELCDRSSEFLMETARRHPKENVIVVTHGGTLRAILSTVLRLEEGLHWKFKIGNTSLSIVDYDGKEELSKSNAFIIVVNDISHIANSVCDATSPSA